MLIDVAVDEERDVGGCNKYSVDGHEFHKLLCLDYSSIYNRLVTNNTSAFLGNKKKNWSFGM
jgi:hypothetical protein